MAGRMRVCTPSHAVSTSAILSITNSTRNITTATPITHHCSTNDGASIQPEAPGDTDERHHAIDADTRRPSRPHGRADVHGDGLAGRATTALWRWSVQSLARGTWRGPSNSRCAAAMWNDSRRCLDHTSHEKERTMRRAFVFTSAAVLILGTAVTSTVAAQEAPLCGPPEEEQPA